ncbi:response regulator transcription factor [Cohnella cholangitidis]|uniref:Response regulator n=1 Tax=Cohnella cholangitidis TaxID=2598458 RepID=A0A7G5C437_9BACL|nr:helix-turn-helix domain-containing protein [Cohnella cholangitidis]QMV43971.1 response regulator [Cohnella cholangitidis]
MKILIVDDEGSAIEAVKKGVQWQKLAITSIYTAMSMNEAIANFNQHSIDILLCDIEMPMGSGLDLLRWVHDNNLNVECIIMTCHADFSYAQQAIQLGSLDYLLKPLSYEKVEETIKKATEKISHERAIKRNSGAWLQNKEAVIRQFWKDYFVGEIAPNMQSLSWYIQAKGMDINLENDYLPILVSLKEMRNEFKKDERRLMEFAIKNVSEEVFASIDISNEVMTFTENTVLIVFQLKQNEKVRNDFYKVINEKCKELITAGKEYLKLVVCCYIGTRDNIYKMPGMIENLQTIDFNNVTYQKNIILLDSYRHHPVEFKNSTLNLWTEYIANHRFHYLLDEIKKTLNAEEVLRKIDRQYLSDFCQSYNYLLFVFATKHNIFLNELLRGEQTHQLSQKAETSLADFLRWAKYTVEKMKFYVEQNIEALNPVDKTKKYIEARISEEITVEDIAQQVHLNSDYLTRIFKKELGISISKYIINRKMEIAKELLKRTDKSIGDIAMAVGYFNYSSFNRIFNKVVGMSPQEYKLNYVDRSR